ncbi:ubiquitin carboxyl-terminal hydrolase 31 [Hemicordylus capensis]|uniref:ubiquitin carboxyl-terminal hydrolase 31 n=1 Tax=Hemicordylus capensis TaxID=884348 RepID=UPI002304C44C|nr:ubiquitin carboxyl-terminal hydrolase 31 [Hemicordylus capensis]
MSGRASGSPAAAVVVALPPPASSPSPRGASPGAAAAASSSSSCKEKRSFSKRLLFRGRRGGGSPAAAAASCSSSPPPPASASSSGPRALGGFMSRVLKTLSTLSHLSSSEQQQQHHHHSLGRCFQPSPEPEPPPPPRPAPEAAPSPPPPAAAAPAAAPSPPPPPPGLLLPAGPPAAGCSSVSCPAVPGVAGLRNHGNTCFMNAVLQCLSNTELFAEYLALEQYRGGGGGPGGGAAAAGPAQESLREEAPLGEEEEEEEAPPPPPPLSAGEPGLLLDNRCCTSETRGGGEVTEQLAQLVRALWTLEYTPQHSREFKSIVSKNAMQYRGSSQHDAQEFLLWLLDRVHEDLNNAVKNNSRPSLKPPLEDDVLIEGPAFPINSTFVQELFQAQYRSSLTCPHCQKQSNTFDPFLCISLPIPLPHTRPLYITVVYRGKCSHCMRIGVAVPLSGTVARLREAVSRETKIPTKQIVLTEMYYDGFHRSFSDTDDLDSVQESDYIFAFETPEIFRPEGILSQRGIHVNSNLNHLKYSADHHRASSYPPQGRLENSNPRLAAASDKIVILVCNRACTGQQGKRFGQPFVLHLEKTIPWDLLQKEILEKMQYFLRPSACLQVCPFSLRVVSAVGITYLLPQEERPLCHLMVERALKSCGQGGPPHVKLVVEWDKETKDYLFVNTEDEYVPDAESVRQQRELHHQPQTCTLSQCFQLYTKEEQLAPDDAWRCPHCKQLQQGSITLSLWTLPDVLIIHLKRFRQEGDRRMKLQNMVRFPLAGLDMTPHVVKRSQSSWSLPSHWSPWRRPYGLGRDPEDFVYDLYAVCNHHGTMQGGHYTAYCKNSVDGLWYCFDDSDVQQLAENEVCKQTAYILFYQRRTAIPSWSANSSVAGSTSSSLCEHWVSRLPGSKQPSIASAASSRRTSLASLSESVELMGERSEDDGGFSTRPFVRSVQRQSLSSRSSVTSPLAASENGLRPSWSLSAKLQMRSSSPSRFPGDSPVHSSASTLERIGESADDKASTSCFGSLRSLSGSYQEPRTTGGRAPLAVMEGVFRDEGPVWRPGAGADAYSKSTALQVDGSCSALDPFDNNNQIAFVDQSDSVESSPVKEGRSFSGIGLSLARAEGPPAKAAESKAALEADRSSRHGRAALPSPGPPLPRQPPASPPPSKHVPKASRSRSRAESSRSSGRHGSPAAGHSRKEAGSRARDAASGASAQQKQKLVSSSSSSSSTAVRRNSAGSSVRGQAPAGKSRTSERSLSREGSKLSLASDKVSVAAGSRTGSPRTSQARGEGRTADGKHVRSSSMASLRSPTPGPRSALKRDSKSEDKGLSFFKSALRQKESRRSADLGKTALLSKKMAAGRNLPEEKPDRSKSSPQPLPRPLSSAHPAATEASPAKRSLLASRKAKSAQLEAGAPQSPGAGKQAAEKSPRTLPPASMPSSAQPPSTSQ